MAAGGHDEEPQQLALLAGVLQRRANRAHHQEEPDQQSDEQQNLPGASQIDVFVALMAPEKRVGIAQLVHDAEPLSGHGTDDNQQQRAEQHIDAEALEFRLVPADQRADEEAGGQPRRGDPEDAQLHMPGARHAIGQPFGELECRRSRRLPRRSARSPRPRSICTRISSDTTQKYLTVARCDGVATHLPERVRRGQRAVVYFLLLRRRTTRPWRRCRPAA